MFFALWLENVTAKPRPKLTLWFHLEASWQIPSASSKKKKKKLESNETWTAQSRFGTKAAELFTQLNVPEVFKFLWAGTGSTLAQTQSYSKPHRGS